MRVLALLIFFYFLFAGDVFATISFRVSNLEKTNDYYSVDAQISGAATGSAYFIQAMLTPVGSGSYFGFTWGQKGEWIKYLSSPDKEFTKSNFPLLENNTVQKILVKPDTDSSKYQGPGEYLLKLKRYTGESSSGYYADNSLTIVLSDPSPSPEETSIPSPSPIPSPTPTPSPSPTNKPTPITISPTKKPSASSTPTATPSGLVLATSQSADPSLAAVLSADNQSLAVDEQEPDKVTNFTFVGVTAIAVGLLALIYRRIKILAIN